MRDIAKPKKETEAFEKRNIKYWAPRISSIMFIVLMYLIIGEDFLNTLTIHPVMYNFLIGTVILALTIVIWKKNGILSGIYFIAVGLIYLFVMWNKLIFASVVSSAFWLFATGILFIAGDKNWPVYIKNIKKLWRTIDRKLVIAHNKNKKIILRRIYGRSKLKPINREHSTFGPNQS